MEVRGSGKGKVLGRGNWTSNGLGPVRTLVSWEERFCPGKECSWRGMTAHMVLPSVNESHSCSDSIWEAKICRTFCFHMVSYGLQNLEILRPLERTRLHTKGLKFEMSSSISVQMRLRYFLMKEKRNSFLWLVSCTVSEWFGSLVDSMVATKCWDTDQIWSRRFSASKTDPDGQWQESVFSVAQDA